MKVTFVSNYINHHQIPFCDAMYSRLGEDFTFIQTEPMEEERVRMGWNASVETIPYLRLYYEQEAACRALIMESDVVLFGGVDEESYIEERLGAGLLTVRLSERIYKSGQWKAVSPRGLKKKYHDHTRHRRSQVYLLCYGGYVASDFHIVRAYPEKMFKWGYFPAKKEYDRNELFAGKKKHSLLWAGRFIDWKHPEYAIQAAARLKKEGIPFTLTMVGGGEMEEILKAMVKEEGLEQDVIFAGFQKPEAVREYMEQSEIYLFTSDYKEGWGAVLNESMNSGCAVVANCGIGAVPFLVKPGKNGLIYSNGEFEVFYGHVKKLLQDEACGRALGNAAYETIVKEWNAEEAAKRLIPFLKGLKKGEVKPAAEGILSPAEVISPRRMYRYLLGENS